MDNIKELNSRITDALSFVRSKIEGFVSEDEAKWLAIAMFLLGVIVGMLISPRKNVAIGSNNSTATNDYRMLDDGLDDDDDDTACCE